jgi:ferredoxin-type protein NapG
MDRRQFFRKGFRNAAKVAISAADQHAAQKASNWLRPPFAIGELDFLLKCTRCDACIEACPHQVIFPLPEARGVTVAGTPALDLLNKGCHLCSDWPCVNACDTGALQLLFNVDDERSEPLGEPQPRVLEPGDRLSNVSVDTTLCLPYLGPECGACRDSCPVSALNWEGNKPVIDQNTCVGCGLCREACITEPKSIAIRSPYSE